MDLDLGRSCHDDVAVVLTSLNCRYILTWVLQHHGPWVSQRNNHSFLAPLVWRSWGQAVSIQECSVGADTLFSRLLAQHDGRFSS